MSHCNLKSSCIVSSIVELSYNDAVINVATYHDNIVLRLNALSAYKFNIKILLIEVILK